MRFDTPKNANYAAVITSVKTVVPLPGRDRIVGLPMFGHQAIAQKGWAPGDLGVFIPAEAALSHEYATANNLYRNADLNEDPTQTGYLEDNRRVKAIKFAGHRSNALFMPLKSLAFTGIDTSQLREGDTFDHLNTIEICSKYEIRPPRTTSTQGNAAPKPRRVTERHFPKHIDTANYWRHNHLIAEDAYVWCTQKLHGTSIRVGNTLVARKLSWRERLAGRLGIQVQQTQYDNVYGSRRVIKDANDPDQNHFYDTDIWTVEGARLDGLIPAGYVVYGELVGWTPTGQPIQQGYTYQVPPGTAQLYIYRVTTVNPDGVTVDLSWPQVEEFCAGLGLNTVPLLWAGFAEDLDIDWWMNRRLHDEGHRRAVPLDPGTTVDEGVVVRVDGLRPTLLKAKASEFFEYESRMLDEGIADLESMQEAA
ncbi:hypothetical protein F5X71_29490 [Nocardia brasiliensis]|uniref:RNA ligase domain-containing protein n=1 Tax=Nocardia brasiliensis TaxID=37326 RepID=A0A6G9XYA0_NOCBR|nr:RNA ligase family protein [Nocardia brasiliensis]QIS05891.1 hypothetical protein F5X71_29490 [Nocardia brasiliensis]